MTIEIDKIHALSLLATIQLALRHPDFPERPTGKWAKQFGENLEKQLVAEDPSLAFVAAAGWRKEFDR